MEHSEVASLERWSCKSLCSDDNFYIEEDILENSFPGIDDFSCVGTFSFLTSP